MLGHTFSAVPFGLDGSVVEIEASLQSAYPQFQITGLPGDVIKESRERVRASLSHLGFQVPSAKLLVHLSPAQTKKQGSQLDLGIAIAALQAESIIPRRQNENIGLIGELTLSGQIRANSHAMPLIEALERDVRVSTVILPPALSWLASVMKAKKCRVASTLAQVIDFFRGDFEPEPCKQSEIPQAAHPFDLHGSLDLVMGQSLAKRALQVAVAGRHHALLIGPPGVGKSLMAQAAPRLFPKCSEAEALEILRCQMSSSIAEDLQIKRPFRDPHHSVSGAGFLGGGSGIVVPGEVSLAHCGVLFLDEFPEFRREVIEGLREPLQNGVVHLSRVGTGASFPARFLLLAAMNPCPCGHSIGSQRRCLCSREAVLKYRKRISGPIWDRLDLAAVLSQPSSTEFRSETILEGFSESEIKAKIERAWEKQCARFGNSFQKNGDWNTSIEHDDLRLDHTSEKLVKSQTKEWHLSYRVVAKWVKVSRTIADLEESLVISEKHLQEAWSLRCFDIWQA